MSHVVTLGEILLRLTTPGYARFAQADRFQAHFGGAEANVAVAIAQLGGRSSFVSRVPHHEIGRRAVEELQRHGVETHDVIRGGDRLGTYYLETGASQRPSKVIYDRAHSSFAEAEPSEFIWAETLRPAYWFHWSGITPAISEKCAQVARDAASAAKTAGIIVSFDLNYRSHLWSTTQAEATLVPLMKYVDICVCGAAEAATILGVEGEDDERIARALVTRYGFRIVVIPQRQSISASTTQFGGLIFTDGMCHRAIRREITIIDRVGAGDAMTGALIYSLLRGDDPQVAIEFAVAAGVLKHTIPGDFPLFSLGEVEALASGRDGGRIQR